MLIGLVWAICAGWEDWAGVEVEVKEMDDG